MNECRTLRVTGRGMIRIKPDTVQVTMTLEGIEHAYTETLRRSAADTETLRNVIEAIGFAREELKTRNFNVQTEYEGYQEDGVYRQRLVGYRFCHELMIGFPWENERLGAVLGALTETALAPEIRITYTVKDREAAKNALIGMAVADAKAKAEALTQAAGVKLKGIRHIQYAIDENEFAVHPVLYAGAARKACADNAAPEIVPEEITAEDTVTVVWAIE
ncbi:MAG: SIMPL domain-containing protein [Clostridia bacterium]|nr:SIMPL domain-containing protein [Clostridia bacterium]